MSEDGSKGAEAKATRTLDFRLYIFQFLLPLWNRTQCVYILVSKKLIYAFLVELKTILATLYMEKKLSLLLAMRTWDVNYSKMWLTTQRNLYISG